MRRIPHNVSTAAAAVSAIALIVILFLAVTGREIGIGGSPDERLTTGQPLIAIGGQTRCAAIGWVSTRSGEPSTTPYALFLIIRHQPIGNEMGFIFGYVNGLVLPISTAAILSALLPFAWIVWLVSRPDPPKPGRCAECGYDLRGLRGRCLECGTTIDPPAQ